MAYKVISANQSPDYSTISRFRKNNEANLKQLFLEVLKKVGAELRFFRGPGMGEVKPDANGVFADH